MIYLRVEAGAVAARALAQIKAVAWDHPGREELTLLVPGVSLRETQLRLGWSWGYADTPECRAALAAFGEVVDGPARDALG